MTDWNFEHEYLLVEDMYTKIINNLLPLIDKNIVLKSMKTSKEFQQIKPKNLLRNRNGAWNSFKLFRSEHGRNS